MDHPPPVTGPEPSPSPEPAASTEAPSPAPSPPRQTFWRHVLWGHEGPLQLGLAYWGGVLVQVALARQAGIALATGDALVALWVLVLGLVVGLYLRGQKKRAGVDLRLVPLLILFTLPLNVAEMIGAAPLPWGWKAAAAAAVLITLWRLRDLDMLRSPNSPP